MATNKKRIETRITEEQYKALEKRANISGFKTPHQLLKQLIIGLVKYENDLEAGKNLGELHYDEESELYNSVLSQSKKKAAQ